MIPLSWFEHAAYQNEGEAMKAIAHLPGLDIEISHRQSPDGLAEQISINLRAVPSFDAFAHAFEALNPFTFWAEAARLAWFPWLEAIRAVTLPPSGARPDRPAYRRLTGGADDPPAPHT
ncbi:MAG TPA: hypothetical protein VFJ49_05070 [Methyloceanibacter sp.]|nr:hypothetical protein [Methyloceanibacter sp.]